MSVPNFLTESPDHLMCTYNKGWYSEQDSLMTIAGHIPLQEHWSWVHFTDFGCIVTARLGRYPGVRIWLFTPYVDQGDVSMPKALSQQ